MTTLEPAGRALTRPIARHGLLALSLASAILAGFIIGRTTAPDPPARYGCAPVAIIVSPGDPGGNGRIC